MDFRWIPWNLAKVANHGVTPEEAEAVILSARRPYPRRVHDGRMLVLGPATGGRLLQVVYLLDGSAAIFVIHARPLTEREKHRYRRTNQ